MRYVTLPSSGERVSRICLGTWPFDARDWGPQSKSESIRVIQEAIDLGVTLIDTAPAYGLGFCEELLGRALEGRRDRVLLATKCGVRWNEVRLYQDLTRESVRWEVEQSLRRLGTDRIDLLQVHWPHAPTPLEETMGALDELRREGLVRHLGVSNFDVPLLEKARSLAPVETLQPPLHLFFRNAEQEILPYCRQHGVPALVYGALCKGLLTGKFRDRPIPDDIRRKDPFFGADVLPALHVKVEELRGIAEEEGIEVSQLALAWTLGRPGVSAAIVGARTREQLRETLRAADVDLSARAREAVEVCLRDVPRVVDR